MQKLINNIFTYTRKTECVNVNTVKTHFCQRKRLNINRQNILIIAQVRENWFLKLSAHENYFWILLAKLMDNNLAFINCKVQNWLKIIFISGTILLRYLYKNLTKYKSKNNFLLNHQHYLYKLKYNVQGWKKIWYFSNQFE